MPYFPVVVAFGQKYDKNLGIGTLISLILFMIWYFLGLPLGSGAPIRI